MATNYFNLCCRSGGSNLNAGSRNGSTTEPGVNADFTYASGTWVAATRTFTRLDAGSFVTDGLATGDLVSIYADGASVTGYTAAIDTVAATTFTTHATRFIGSVPADGTANRTVKVGGACRGPNGSVTWPTSSMSAAFTNAAGDTPRVNYKNDGTYSMSSGIAIILGSTNSGPCVHEGYASTYGDNGLMTLDGGTSGASVNLIQIGASTVDLDFRNMIVQNNGATGAAAGISLSGGGIARNNFFRVCVNNIRGAGITLGGSNTLVEECEFYSCNQNNSANTSGVNVTGTNCVLRRIVSHDNTGSNNMGCYVSSVGAPHLFEDSFFVGNGLYGLHYIAGACWGELRGGGFYDNANDGLRLANTGASRFTIENCNFIKNGTGGTGWGINGSGAGTRIGRLTSCGFGQGSQANGSGTFTGLKAIREEDVLLYANDVTPWVDPANGDFRIALAAAKGSGRGGYLLTAPGYAGVVAYPDRGAAQHLDAGGGGIGAPIIGLVSPIIRGAAI